MALLREAAKILVEAVEAAGDFGVPGGVIYASLMDKVSLATFEQLMGGLVRGGYLRKSGDVYHFVKEIA